MSCRVGWWVALQSGLADGGSLVPSRVPSSLFSSSSGAIHPCLFICEKEAGLLLLDEAWSRKSEVTYTQLETERVRES